jgi:hypothetical protein
LLDTLEAAVFVGVIDAAGLRLSIAYLVQVTEHTIPFFAEDKMLLMQSPDVPAEMACHPY